MTSQKFDPKLTPRPPSITWLFHWQLSTECHTIQYPPPPTCVMSYIAALWQAKFYLPRQAEAPAAPLLWHRSRGACVLWLVYCGSCTAAAALPAAAVNDLVYFGTFVYCGGAAVGVHVPQRRNVSPFIRSPTAYGLILVSSLQEIVCTSWVFFPNKTGSLEFNHVIDRQSLVRNTY